MTSAPSEDAWTPRPAVIAELRARLAALRENDPDMPDLEVLEVALEPGEAVLRVVFTHGRYPGKTLGVRFNADLRNFPPDPGTEGMAAREDQWLWLLPHNFVEAFWTHRSRRMAGGITWFERES